MTDEELKEIEARLNAATPGPPQIAYTSAVVGGQGTACDESVIELHLLKTDIRKLLDEVKALRERFLCEHDIPKHSFCVECRL